MSNNDVFNDDVLSQIKSDVKGGVKVVTHLDHLPEPYFNETHIQDHFDSDGNYIGESSTDKALG